MASSSDELQLYECLTLSHVFKTIILEYFLKGPVAFRLLTGIEKRSSAKYRLVYFEILGKH